MQSPQVWDTHSDAGSPSVNFIVLTVCLFCGALLLLLLMFLPWDLLHGLGGGGIGRPENCFAGGGWHGRPAKEGGGFQKWASVPGPLFCVRTDVATKGAGTQILVWKNFFHEKMFPHMCVVKMISATWGSF